MDESIANATVTSTSNIAGALPVGGAMRAAPKPPQAPSSSSSTPAPEPEEYGFCGCCSSAEGSKLPPGDPIARLKTGRTSAFEKPYDNLQIATWFLFPLVIVHFYCFVYFLLWPHIASRVVITLFFSICTAIAFYSTYKVCTIDPIDDEQIATGNLPNSRYCYQCDRRVGRLSLHCHDCRKCVQVFDHHCRWLNTCVGKKNYRYFLGVIFSVCGLTTLSMSLNIAFLIELCQYPSQFQYRMEYSNLNYVFLNMYDNTCLGVLIFSLILLIPLVLSVWQLTFFHCYLVYNKLTTYEFIMGEQRKIREKIDASKPVQNRPVVKSSIDLVPIAAKPSSHFTASASDNGNSTVYVKAQTSDLEANNGNNDSDADSDGFEHPEEESGVAAANT